MSNKLIKSTPEQRQQRENEQYLNGKPSRLEVANYVNSLLEEKYMPQIQGQTSLGFMVIQAILIEKGVCTGEEIEELTKKFIKQKQQEVQVADSEQKQDK